MVLIPEEVRCAVCKTIFCCLDCRIRHEQNAHNPNEVWSERNRLRCGFCQGYPTMEFKSRNDFALIMHLCQNHLPLHCKKCLTQFNSIGDFSAANKCAHINDICNLQSPKRCNVNKMENPSANSKDETNVKYITAVQKSSFERSISDSVISLRNYSTILHSSNHPLYKTQSPDAMEKALVRQTSTPMHHNLMANSNASPESNGSNEQACSSCFVSTTSGQVSCINSSCDSDTSTNSMAKPNEVRQDGAMVNQMKTSSFKRPRNSPAVTPLTRQVMTKSIHRAILEFHSQNGTVLSPKSPLDLRVRPAIRDAKNASGGEKNPLTAPNGSGTSPKMCERKSHFSFAAVRSNSLDSNSRMSPLETVYEQDRDAIVESPTDAEHDCDISPNCKIIKISSDNEVVVNELSAGNPISETPVAISRKLSAELKSGTVQNDNDTWYTPKQFLQANVIENIEIYTPKISKKKATARRVDGADDDESTDENMENDIQTLGTSNSEPSKGSKLWSFVSTLFRFASLRPLNDLSPTKGERDDSTVIIRRCTSFTGILRDNNTSASSDDEFEGDPLHPMKRRRITSIDSGLDQLTVNVQKRIRGRPPIRRMLKN